jgi:hypothetical protein
MGNLPELSLCVSLVYEGMALGRAGSDHFHFEISNSKPARLSD